MNVLVACEESQAVCIAFRERGHRAFSCDIEPCSGGHPEWHILADVLPLLNGNCTFQTADSHTHTHTARAMGHDYRPPAVYLPDKRRGGQDARKRADSAGAVSKGNGGKGVFHVLL